MRVFVAVELEPDARRSIRGVIDRVRRRIGHAGPRITWVDEDHLHITLHFLGELAEAPVERVLGALGPPLAQPPFRLSLGHIGALPASGPPRVILIGLDLGGAAVASLHAEIGRRLRDVGCGIESRPFSPHVTIGRVRARGNARTRTLMPFASTIEPPIGSFVECVTVFESRLTDKGSIYRPLARAPLARS